MTAKIKLATTLVSILFVVLGIIVLFNNYQFYKKAAKTRGVITKVDFVSIAGMRHYEQFPLSRDVTFSFRDSLNSNTSSILQVSTLTLVSGALGTGSVVELLYKPKFEQQLTNNDLIKNIGPTPYSVKLYTWHYWFYPILLILLGPLFYWAVKKLISRRVQN